MLIKRRRGWELPESMATPEALYFGRRDLLKIGAASAVAVALPATAQAEADPSAKLYPFKRNESYKLDRELTEEKTASTYNNFYEFGSHKKIADAAQALNVRPWTVQLDGMVEQPQTIDFDTLLAKMPKEERLYRLRCVEAWSMAIPWSGFPMKALVELAKPLSSAKYVEMLTFLDAKVAPGQRQFWYPWPYREGITIEEATNDLTFLVTGAYGKPLAKQFGAPLRLALPWKYGFKSIKSIVKFSFTDKRPVSFWEKLQAQEYGFWANVNPMVPHPRWSQATEEVIGAGGKRVPTLPYNGYGEFVAHMYKGKEGEKLFL
jgi:methionine sulfoxide reductase catalytic subunit